MLRNCCTIKDTNCNKKSRNDTKETELNITKKERDAFSFEGMFKPTLSAKKSYQIPANPERQHDINIATKPYIFPSETSLEEDEDVLES